MGSEMCIRDSNTVVQGEQLTTFKQTTRGARISYEESFGEILGQDQRFAVTRGEEGERAFYSSKDNLPKMTPDSLPKGASVETSTVKYRDGKQTNVKLGTKTVK